MDPQAVSETFTQRELNVRQKKFIENASFHFSQIEEMLTEIEKTALVVNKAISRLHDGQEA